jgi:transcription initiation factor TFIIB
MSQLFLTQPLTFEPVDPCPLCGTEEGFITDVYTYEEICTTCGCVVNDILLIRGVNNRNYNQDRGNKRRHGEGAKPSVYDKGMNTFITGKKDAYGTPLNRETMKNIKRLQKQDNRSKINESVMRNLSVAMMELDRLITNLNLPDYIKEDAALIYRRALKKDLIRGRSIDAFIAASVYAACRMQSIPRPLKTVAEESKRLYKEVSMTYRMLLEELNLKPPVDRPLKYVSKLAIKLEIPRPTELKAVEILKEAGKMRVLSGKDPRGVAAAALYLASELNGEKVVQSTIARAAETTEVTLRNRYRGLKKALSIV